jgi:nitroreductase
MIDKYQERYLNHQKKKKEVLIQLLEERHSDRVFTDTEVTEQVLLFLDTYGTKCPSSCNRQGIHVKKIFNKDLKNLLGGILVGGIGWIHRAPVILLFFADIKAYKAEGEVTYMPYLDTGVKVFNYLLLLPTVGLSGCFVNPNIRDINKSHFYEIFFKNEQVLFTGALVLGYKKIN